jgi:hypothetical protein
MNMVRTISQAVEKVSIRRESNLEYVNLRKSITSVYFFSFKTIYVRDRIST